MKLVTVLGIVVAAFVAVIVVSGQSSGVEPALEAEETAFIEAPALNLSEDRSQAETKGAPSQSDVRAYLLGAFPELPEAARVQSIDVSMSLHRLGLEQEVDPLTLTDEYIEVLRTTLAIQPHFEKGWDGGVSRAMLVAFDIYRGCYEIRNQSCVDIDDRFEGVVASNNLGPVNSFIVLSIGYRESSLTKAVELGHKLGSAGERGMFQFRPAKSGQKGFIEARFMPRFNDRNEACSPFDRMCAVRGVVNALAWIRCECIHRFGDRCDIDTYVAGYGMNRLPDPAEARGSRGPVNARRFLCSATEQCDEYWPVMHNDAFAETL